MTKKVARDEDLVWARQQAHRYNVTPRPADLEWAARQPVLVGDTVPDAQRDRLAHARALLCMLGGWDEGDDAAE